MSCRVVRVVNVSGKHPSRGVCKQRLSSLQLNLFNEKDLQMFRPPLIVASNKRSESDQLSSLTSSKDRPTPIVDWTNGAVDQRKHLIREIKNFPPS